MILENTPSFIDSDQEAQQLADKLYEYENKGVIVVAVSNAGWPIANRIAKQLKADFTFVPVETIKNPADPLKTIGVVSFDYTIINESYRDIPQDYLSRQAQTLQADLIGKHEDFYKTMAGRFQEKIVILADHTATTSHEILACLKTIRKQKPKKIVVAVSEITEEAANEIVPEAEELIFSTRIGKFMQNDFSNYDRP